MIDVTLRARFCALALILAALTLAGCESMGINATKKIDYKSAASAPSLELPPDLTTPQYDDRYAVTTASGLAAQQGQNRNRNAPIAVNANVNGDARVMRAGTERWLVVKTTPEVAWRETLAFWPTVGFAMAVEQPTLGIMETDWAENRANVPSSFLQNTIGKFVDIFGNTYRRDKFRTRIERGSEPGTMEIYISHRGAEQVPTTKIDNVSPAGFVWAVMPPDPGLEAEMLSRLMVRFGTPEPAATAALQASGSGAEPDRARLEKTAAGSSELVVDDSFDRAWRRVGLALDRVGFTVVDRDRSKGTYFVRYANPETDVKKEKGFLDKLMFWKTDAPDTPEQYRITIAQADPRSIITVQDPNGAPDKTANGEKILALLKDQLK